MKKILLIFSFLIFALIPASADVMNLETAIAKNSSKPMAVLIYANWADNYQAILQEFRKVERNLSNSYNFVELDIASKDAKIFNNNYVIYTKLPYIMLFRSNGKFSFLINRECTASSSCTISKMRTFERK